MRTFRTCCCILCVPLLGILGCTNSHTKGQPVTVTITNCKANPDRVDVHRGDDLTWNIEQPDSHSYSISFKGHTPFSSSTVPPGQSQKVVGDLSCNYFGWIHGDFCWYPYAVVGSNCADPGVHIVR